MIWGGIGEEILKTQMVVMKRDAATSRHGGYLSSFYGNTLESEFPLTHNSSLYQEDIIHMHTSVYTCAWHAIHGIQKLPNWPPCSPDLSPNKRC